MAVLELMGLAGVVVAGISAQPEPLDMLVVAGFVLFIMVVHKEEPVAQLLRRVVLLIIRLHQVVITPLNKR
jgi:hypothetical protein